MRYLKISNPGSFDVASAVNMLGASVKVNDNPIGMFGSGTKFALAQAVRTGVEMKIYDGERMFNVGVSEKSFRDRSFSMVALNALHKRIVTPITADFGGKDWNEDWFIFREFYSNALDEGNASLSIVDSAEPTPNETSVFLPYERFKEFHKNVTNYFNSRKSGEFWVGDGSMYKRGVFIGKMEGTTINFNHAGMRINECRVMDKSSVYSYIGSYIGDCSDVEVWKAYFNSTDDFKAFVRITPYDNSPAIYTAIHNALVSLYGDKYCIVPKVDSIIRDACSMGMYPVVLPDTVSFNSKILRVYLEMNDTKVVRAMNEDEQKKYDSVRNKISAFIPTSLELNVKVFSEGLEGVLGDARTGTNQIRIRDTVFNDEHKLMHTVIHEIGHIKTLAGDYDRVFTAYFVDLLVNLAK